MNVAVSPQDAKGFKGLGSSPMAPRIYGPRVISAVVPRFFPTVHALQIATGMAYSTLNDWANGKADPRLEALDKVIDAILKKHNVRVDALELLRGGSLPSVPQGRLRDHPEWHDAVEEAKRKRPNRLTPAAYSVASDTSPARWPEHIDWTYAYEMADFWFRHSKDTELAEAETALARAEMAAEDAEVEAALRRKQAANEPKPKSKDKDH